MYIFWVDKILNIKGVVLYRDFNLFVCFVCVCVGVNNMCVYDDGS